jgi:hypothetical protein
MLRTLVVVVLVMLAGCSGAPQGNHSSSPCASKGEASRECQTMRYMNAP